MSEEFTDKRFGEVAVEKGLISTNQLEEGLVIQVREENKKGMRRVIGAILIEKGYMNLSQVQEVVEAM